MNVLDHRGCDKVFYYFEAICDIPHGSESAGARRCDEG